MSSISIMLRTQKRNKAGECPLRIKHSHDGSNYEKGLGIVLADKDWDKRREQVKSSHPLADAHNETIRVRRRELEDALSRLAQKHVAPTREVLEVAVAEVREIAQNLPGLREKLDVARGNRLVRMESELHELEQKVLDKKEQIRRWHKLHGTHQSLLVNRVMVDYIATLDLELSTKRIYETVQRLLAEWRADLSVGDVTPAALDEFKTWLAARGCKASTIKTYLIKVLKFSRWAAKHYTLDQVHELTDYRHGVEVKQKKITYLNADEVEKLELVELPSASLQDVRDLMLLMITTGLRISDAGITQQQIIDNQVVLTTKKTGTEVTIPLAASAQELLERRSYQMPTFSYSYFSREIKTVARLAKLTRTIYQDGKYRPLHEVISAHWGRRTFASMAIAAGTDVAVVKEWLGHARIDQLLASYAGAMNQREAMNKVFPIK